MIAMWKLVGQGFLLGSKFRDYLTGDFWVNDVNVELSNWRILGILGILVLVQWRNGAQAMMGLSFEGSCYLAS